MYKVKIILLFLTYSLVTQPKPFCVIHAQNNQEKMVCRNSPHPKVLKLMKILDKLDDPKKILSEFNQIDVILVRRVMGWVLSSEVDQILVSVKPKTLKLLIMLLSKSKFNQYLNLTTNGIIQAWKKKLYQVLPLWLSVATEEEFIFALRVIALEYPKEYSYEQIAYLYKECQRRGIKVYYGITGIDIFIKRNFNYQDEEPMDSFSDYLFFQTPKKKILKFAFQYKDLVMEVKDQKVELEKIILLIQKEINHIHPDQQITVLDQLIKIEEWYRVKLLRKYGAKTYQELQELKKKKEK